MTKQHANPGGVLAPHEVIGRDRLVAKLWKRLERQSLYITAERRMGKTSVVRDKMGQNPPEGWKLIYLDVSRAVTPLQFVDALLEVSRPHLDGGKKAKFAFFDVLGKIGGTEFKAAVGVKLPDAFGLHWKTLLETLLRDLASLDTKVVLAFDELPLMLDAIKRNQQAKQGNMAGEALIMELLDTLRAIRQEQQIRMIYTGSLGLHHVLTLLREQGYQNDPTNDMALIDLPQLTPEDATDLAHRLLRGEEIDCDDIDVVAGHLATVTDGIAFYIQHLVSELSMADQRTTKAEADRMLQKCLTDPLDRWHLNYYDERIDTHYPTAYRPIARAVLDQLTVGKPQNVEELTEGIDPTKIDRDPETVHKVLNLLGMDHYTSPDATDPTRYGFRSHFIMTVWRTRRGKGG